jgi:hypothetical protein
MVKFPHCSRYPREQKYLPKNLHANLLHTHSLVVDAQRWRNIKFTWQNFAADLDARRWRNYSGLRPRTVRNGTSNCMTTRRRGLSHPCPRPPTTSGDFSPSVRSLLHSCVFGCPCRVEIGRNEEMRVGEKSKRKIQNEK